MDSEKKMCDIVALAPIMKGIFASLAQYFTKPVNDH